MSAVAAQPAFVPALVHANASALYNLRVAASVVAGLVSGVLGLTNTAGVVAYLAALLATSAAVLIKLRGKATLYFVSWKAFAFDGLFDAALTYLLFWTLVYNVVHLYV